MTKPFVAKMFGMALMGTMLTGCGVSATNLSMDRNLGSLQAKSQITGTKRALLVGINKYTYINGLQGCINDINDTKAQILSKNGFKDANVVTLLDAKATRANILDELKKMVAASKPGDFVYFHYSGHGSQIRDTNGDEPDGQDEIICPVDIRFANNSLTNAVVDDEIQSTMGQLKSGVGLLFISDSCNSGTVDKNLKNKVRGINLPQGVNNVTPMIYDHAAAQAFKSRTAAGKYHLISGCQDEQTSADAYINNRYNGALTYYLLDTLKAGGMQMTYSQWHQGTVAAIAKNGYEQRPNLVGDLNATVFTIAD